MRQIGRRALIASIAAFAGLAAGGRSALADAAAQRVKRVIRVPRGGVTHLVVRKRERKLYVMSGWRVVRVYPISLGFSPEGHKRKEGDGRTPEGRYIIDRRNRDSAYYLSLGISYPNARDRARARRLGVDPGGDIFIHGMPNDPTVPTDGDWTAGCIAVSNDAIEDLWVMVEDGTPIIIRR